MMIFIGTYLELQMQALKEQRKEIVSKFCWLIIFTQHVLEAAIEINIG